jgi:hypothetical protein
MACHLHICHCAARADTAPLLRELPLASVPPEGEPHNSSIDTKLDECHPYVISPAIRTLDVDLFFQPSSAIPLDSLQLQVSAHFHGVSHAGGPSAPARFPYVSSCIENAQSPVKCLDLKRIQVEGHVHGVACRCELNRVPLGVSCILLTVSSAQLNHVKSIMLSVLKMNHDRGRVQIAHKRITRENLGTILAQAQRDKGTVTLAALVMNAGWWHIYSFQSFFANASADDFIQRSCYPRRVRAGGVRACVIVVHRGLPAVDVWVLQACRCTSMRQVANSASPSPNNSC